MCKRQASSLSSPMSILSSLACNQRPREFNPSARRSCSLQLPGYDHNQVTVPCDPSPLVTDLSQLVPSRRSRIPQCLVLLQVFHRSALVSNRILREYHYSLSERVTRRFSFHRR